MLNRRLLVSDARHFDNLAQINPYYTDSTVDVAKAVSEHESICELFEQSGIEVIHVASPPTSQDGVYAANWALVHNGKAVLSRLPEARRSEEAYALSVLKDMGYETIVLDNDLKFSGQGDALRCGDLLFSGQGYRSDATAQSHAASFLGLKLVQLETVPLLDGLGQPSINQASGWADSFFYDIDIALSIIREPTSDARGLIAYCPAAFTLASIQTLERLTSLDRIIVSEEEAKQGFACNLVSTGETVIMSEHAPELAANLRRYGLDVKHPHGVTELLKGGGFIRCISLALD